MFVLMLFVEAVLFGIFTACMMSEQCSAVSTQQTHIDRLKNVRHETEDSFNEVFGTETHNGFQLSWLIPTGAIFPAFPDPRREVRGFPFVCLK